MQTTPAPSGVPAGPTPAALRAAADRYRGHPAIIDRETQLSWADLLDEVRTAARALIARGIAAGDRVAIWSPNTYHWVIAALATHYAGAVLVPVNTRYTSAEAHDILDRTHARALFVAGRFLGVDRLAELRAAGELDDLDTVVRIPVATTPVDGIPVDGDEPGADLQWSDLTIYARAVSPHDADERATAVQPDDIADILFTSGTTGRSKGVLSTHRQSLSGPAAWAERGELTAADRYLVINPFFHSFGYKAGILACLQTGATLVPQVIFDPPETMRLVQDLRITVLPGAPTIFQTLLDDPRRSEFDLSSLRFAVTGAAVVPVALIERMQSELSFDLVLTAYGLTECGGFASMCRRGDDPATVATTCGQAMGGFTIAIAESGEVLLTGPNTMVGYLDDPAATAGAIDADGWLHTGDIGELTPTGHLRITDRLKDMYICGGFNVYPAEVEQTLARLPEVTESAVIGVPDERLGEVGKAYVVTAPCATLTADDVTEYLRRHLANFKAPRFVEFCAELPRNASGKVLKHQLRQENR